MVTVPEYKDPNNLKLHVFRYDIPGKGWKSLFLKYPSGAIAIKEAKDTSYEVFPHTDSNATFKPLEPIPLKIEKNIFQLKDIRTIDNVRDTIISDFNKMLHVNFKISSYTIEEFEKLLVEDSSTSGNTLVDGLFDTSDNTSSKLLAERTLKAFKDIGDQIYKQHIASYYLLYTRGGVYLDPKSILKRSLEDKFFHLTEHDGFIAMYDNNNGIPELGFIACKKGSSLIGDTLNKALSNIENRYYGTSSQEPTGNLCFRDIILKGTKEGKTLKYGGETFYVLREEAGRLYDETNRMVWNRDVYTNIMDKSLDNRVSGSNLWLQCRLYPDGNCYSLSNWKFYASESSETQSALAILAVSFIIALAIFIYYKMI